MTLQNLKFLTDENIDTEVFQFLKSEGLDVLDIKNEGLFGMKDKEILDLAFSQNRIIISQDSDFGTLVFRDNIKIAGIIYLRPGHTSAEIHIATMRNLLRADLSISLPFILVAENKDDIIKVRLRNI